MPYDPIRDASSSGPTSTTPNGTYQSPSASARALSPSSAGLHPTPRGGYPPAFGSSTGEDVPPRSPLIAGPSSSAGPSMSGPVEGGGSLLSARRPAAPPSKRLSLSMLLNENKQQLTPEHESTPRLGLSPSSADRPPVRPSLQPSPAGSWSSQLSPSVREPSPSTLSTHPHQPTPPGPRRTSLTSEPSRESSQPLPTPAVVAPPGFTDEDATTSKSDTSFVMDAVNPALKRKRDSLVAADGLAGQRRKSSTSSVVSRSSSGRNGSIGGEPDEFRRKSSSAGSSTSSQPPASHPLQSIHPRPSVLAQPYPTDSTPPAPPSAPPPPPSQPPLPSSSAYLPPSHLPPRPPPQSHHSSHHPPPPPPPPNPRLPPPGPAHPSSQPIMQPPPPDPSAPRRTAYAPRNRTSAPRSVLTPISWDEYTQLRDHPELVTKNPMRGKGPRQPKAARVTPAPAPASLPSSVSARPTPSNGGSYFPTNAAASSSSRPPSSSGVGAEGGVGAVGEVEQPGDADDDYVPMSPAAVVPTKRSASGQPEDGDNRRRRVDGSGGFVNADVAKVASHYNARPEVGLQNRNLSPIIGLKNFNNWVKSVLIGKFTRLDRPPLRRQDPPSGVVLDLGCGKGGDLRKWAVARVQHYMAFDIAEVSVSQAHQRANEMRNCPFSFEFYQLDCFGESISTLVPEQRLLQFPIDMVTMQFCMHYAFETEAKARQMLDNVTRYLRPGGTFVGTIPNADKLIQNLKEIPEGEERLAFGNEVYEIAFDDRSEFPIYGHRYSFFLNDAVEDVPEYLVHWDNFESLAAEFGLSLVYKREFHEVFEEERDLPEFGPLLTKMRVMNEQGESEMTVDQYEAANLYLAFAFQKL